MNQQLSLDEIAVHPSSGADWNGLVFERQGRFYRAIPAANAGFTQSLFDKKIIAGLVESGLLIESEVSAVALADYPLVIAHRKVPFVTYPCEWSATMLKDAALLLVDLELKLAGSGLSNHDPHPWNVLFEASKPYFVDLGALMPAEDTSLWTPQLRNRNWPGYRQFCETVLYPLQLMAWGYRRIARSSLADFVGISESERQALIPSPWSAFGTWIRKTARAFIRRGARYGGDRILERRRSSARQASSGPGPAAGPRRPPDGRGETAEPAARARFLKDVRSRIERLDVAVRPSRRGASPPPPADRPDALSGMSPQEWAAKKELIHGLLLEHRPASVHDLGCRTGVFSKMAAEAGAAVIASDEDEALIEALYEEAKAQSLNIIPLVMSFRSPTPGAGPANQWLSPATRRLRCDMALALGLLPHLVCKQYMTFAQIAETASLFSTRWAVLEFIPPDDPWVKDMFGPEFGWYTLDNLSRSLKRHFDGVEIRDSCPGQRKLLFCEKRGTGDPDDAGRRSRGIER